MWTVSRLFKEVYPLYFSAVHRFLFAWLLENLPRYFFVDLFVPPFLLNLKCPFLFGGFAEVRSRWVIRGEVVVFVWEVLAKMENFPCSISLPKVARVNTEAFNRSCGCCDEDRDSGALLIKFLLEFDGTWRPPNHFCIGYWGCILVSGILSLLLAEGALHGLVWLALNQVCLQPDIVLYTTGQGCPDSALETTTMHVHGLTQFIPLTVRFNWLGLVSWHSLIVTRRLRRSLKTFLVQDYFSLCSSASAASFVIDLNVLIKISLKAFFFSLLLFRFCSARAFPCWNKGVSQVTY